MTLQELRYLVAVAGTRNFGQAARACSVTQPTLSTQIKKLETHLGITLLERTNKSVQVTPTGRKIVEMASRVIDQCKQIEQLAAAHADPFVEPVRLGIIPTLGPYLLPRILPSLREHFPRLRLIVHEDLTSRMVAHLRSYRLDAILLALPVSEPELEVFRVFDEPFLLACPEGHPLAGRKKILSRDLEAENLLLLAEGHCLRDHALNFRRSHTPIAAGEHGDHRAASLETLCQMVAGGFGCTLLPALAVSATARRESGVRTVPLAGNGAARQIGMVCRPGFPRTSLVADLAGHIRAAINKLPGNKRAKTRAATKA